MRPAGAGERRKPARTLIGGASPEDDDRYTAYLAAFTFLALFGLVIGVLMFICAWIVTPVVVQVGVTFTFLSIIVLVANGLSFGYRHQILANACGTCPLQTAGSPD